MAGDITLEKNVPHSIDAERSVLGAILIENSSINRAQEILNSRHPEEENETEDKFME